MISKHEEYMKKAIKLALRGSGYVNPNPLVGAVIVKNNRIIGEGWHRYSGGLHAEREALKNCTEDPSKATMYVTLEPCCHSGKQPPCTDAIIEAGISTVYIGSRDPNTLVSGKGVEILKAHGVTVYQDLLKEDCDGLNPVFFHYISTGRPYVLMKYAMSADGKIACFNGRSKWITSEETRMRGHSLRGRLMGIMVGSGTVLADNPSLTCRNGSGPDPVRIICDSRLRTPLDSQLVKTAPHSPMGTKDTENNTLKYRNPRTIIATSVTDPSKLSPYRDAGVHIITLPCNNNGHIDLKLLMKEVGALGIDSILLEGGGKLNWSALEAEIVNHIQVHLSPMIIGGSMAPSPVSGQGSPDPGSAFRLVNCKTDVTGPDLVIDADLSYTESRKDNYKKSRKDSPCSQE